MAKILKLTGIETYVSPATSGVIVKRGDVCKFSDAVSTALLKGSRKDREGEDISYWVEQDEDEPTKYDFTKPVTNPANPLVVRDSDNKGEAIQPPQVIGKQAVKEAPPVEAPVATVKRSQRSKATA